MIIKNARVFTEDGSFMQGDVVVKDGRFVQCFGENS